MSTGSTTTQKKGEPSKVEVNRERQKSRKTAEESEGRVYMYALCVEIHSAQRYRQGAVSNGSSLGYCEGRKKLCAGSQKISKARGREVRCDAIAPVAVGWLQSKLDAENWLVVKR